METRAGIKRWEAYTLLRLVTDCNDTAALEDELATMKIRDTEGDNSVYSSYILKNIPGTSMHVSIPVDDSKLSTLT